ncbi:MAG: histidine kinase dimerization/phosphoacceptor domain -containing protein [Bacteroidota bacterium]
MLSQSFTKYVLNNFLEHIFVLNSKQEILFQTDGNESLLGFTNGEIADGSFSGLFIDPNFSFKDTIAKAKKFGEFISTENFKHKTKKYINIAFRVVCHEDEISKEELYIFYVRDNTQQNIVRKDILKKSLTIEGLSKSRMIRDGHINEAIYEILEASSRAVQTTRVNAWLFDENHTKIQCIGNYDARENKLVHQTSLPRILMPQYFKLFETEKIIITPDTSIENRTDEMDETYLKPNDIQSLMDIPVRVEGEMIGVICFENVGTPREWTLMEQKYGLVAAQMVSLAIETYNKQNAKLELESSLNEKTVLLNEVNHRVKNNLAIVGSLLNLQSEKSKDDYHKQLFIEARNRLDSISTVHELIYKSKNYTKIDFKAYLDQIIDHITGSYKSFEYIKIVKEIEEVHVNISSAIPLALIVNELITNSYKHAFKSKKTGGIEITLSEKDGLVFLGISDNGQGFDKDNIPKTSMGMDILNGLINQIEGSCDLTSNENGTSYKISFSNK